MTRGRLAAFACFGFLLIEAGLFFAAPAEMVSVTVVGYTTNKWDAESAAELGEESYVCAIVGFTNVSDRVITYDSYSPGSALGCVVMVDPQNDETEYGLALCGTGLSSYRLAPMQGFTFETVVPIDRACRIAVDYSNGEEPAKIWEKLPWWIVQRIPGALPWRTVMTEEIDLQPEN